MNALAGQGVDRRSVVDRRSLLRFCGGHGLLRPAAGPR
jgi:F420-non-reducing hydrogenase small subunit